MTRPDWTFEPKLIDPRVHDRIAVVEVIIRLPLDAAAGGFVRYQRFHGEQGLGDIVLVLEESDLPSLALEGWAKRLLETKGAIERQATETSLKNPTPTAVPSLGGPSGLGQLG